MEVQGRIIKLFGEINEEMAFAVWSALRFFEGQSRGPIVIVINSAGGNVVDMFAIIDAIASSSCPIATIGTGIVASAATGILVSGTPGNRYLTPHCSVMLHEMSMGDYGKLTDLQAAMAEGRRKQRMYEDHMISSTGIPLEILRKHMAGPDKWMSATTAVRLRLADQILRDLI